MNKRVQEMEVHRSPCIIPLPTSLFYPSLRSLQLMPLPSRCHSAPYPNSGPNTQVFSSIPPINCLPPPSLMLYSSSILFPSSRFFTCFLLPLKRLFQPKNSSTQNNDIIKMWNTVNKWQHTFEAFVFPFHPFQGWNSFSEIYKWLDQIFEREIEVEETLTSKDWGNILVPSSVAQKGMGSKIFKQAMSLWLKGSPFCIDLGIL